MLERCTHVMREDGTVKPLTAGLRQTIEHAVEDMAKDALRCLVAAQKVSSRLPINSRHVTGALIY